MKENIPETRTAEELRPELAWCGQEVEETSTMAAAALVKQRGKRAEGENRPSRSWRDVSKNSSPNTIKPQDEPKLETSVT